MDYIFFSAILSVTLLAIAISYDIVCQWKINLRERMHRLPEHVTQQEPGVPLLEKCMRYGLPVWHASAHKENCQIANLLRLQPGLAHTDREGVERGWSCINGLSSSTKEMGQGARHDTLNNHFGYHNWQRNIGLGLLSHLVIRCFKINRACRRLF